MTGGGGGAMTLSSSRRPGLVALHLLLLVLLPFSRTCLGLALDDIQDWEAIASCNTTIQGRYLRSDDRGYVCRIMEVHPLTGCCPKNDEQYTCRGCNMDSQCCSGYEFCVACCLNPIRTPPEIALKTKIAKQITAGTSANVFDYCRARCRHNSGSVVHENAYASIDHHCFGPQDISSDQKTERDDPDLKDLTVIIGRQGQSCDAACRGRGKTCKLSAIPDLNNCTKLKKYLICKDSCIASSGLEYPADVVSSAPRHMHPGACMYSTGKAPFSCQGFHPYSRRLCPCE